MNEEPKRGVGRASRGGIIVATRGRKWGVVQMPDGRRVVHDVSEIIAASADGPAAPAVGRRLLGLASYDDLADDDRIEAFTQALLQGLSEAHRDVQERHGDAVPEEHDGLA